MRTVQLMVDKDHFSRPVKAAQHRGVLLYLSIPVPRDPRADFIHLAAIVAELFAAVAEAQAQVLLTSSDQFSPVRRYSSWDFEDRARLDRR